MFCPKCETEYRPGFTVCSDCGTKLVSHLPVPPPDNPDSHAAPTLLRTYANRFEAEVAKTALDAAGIESMIRSDDTGREMFVVSLTRGVELFVGPADVAAANDVLNVEGLGKEPGDEHPGG